MKKPLLLGLLGIALAVALGLTDSAWAGEKKNRNPKKKKPNKNKVIKVKPIPGMFTVTGIISKTSINDKEVYILTSRSGNIVTLPAPREPKKAPEEDASEEINIEDYLDQRVTIFGKGFSNVVKNSPAPKVSIREIVSIRKVSAKEEEEGKQ